MTRPQQERATRTRAAIIAAAASVFDRSGYDLASIAEILAEAEVTKGALYFHFPSKESLARAVIDAQTTLVSLRQHETRVQSTIDLTFDVAAALLYSDPVMRAGVRLTIEHGSWKASETEPYLDWIALTEGTLVAACEHGELLPRVRPRQAAEMIVGGFTGIQLLSEVLNGRKDLVKRVSEFWTYILPGLIQPEFRASLRLKPAPARRSGATTSRTRRAG